MTNLAVNETEMVESKSLRERYLDKMEVLDKVKTLISPVGMSLYSQEKVADYFEVDEETIKKLATRHKEELMENGYRTYKKAEIIEQLRLGLGVHNDKDFEIINFQTTSTVIANGYEVSISNKGKRLFSRRAVLNVGMLLRDSPVAKKLRKYLLDIERISTEEQKEVVVEQIDKEKQMLLDVIMASSDEERLLALGRLRDFQKSQKEDLELTIEALSNGNLEWEVRPAINKLARELGANNGNYALGWSMLRDELLYNHGIGIKSRITHKQQKSGRKTKPTMFDVMNPEETRLALKVIASLCKANGIDSGVIASKIKEQDKE